MNETSGMWTVDWVPIVVASLAAVAAVASAVAAWKMVRIERFREKNRILLLKHQSEAEHLEKLIVSFAKVIALGSSQWSQERNDSIDKTVQEIQLHVSVLEALITNISTDITRWVQTSDQTGNSVAGIVYFELGQLHPIAIGHKEFFESKTKELKEIQDKMYSKRLRINAPTITAMWRACRQSGRILWSRAATFRSGGW